jgi:organic radical activating enzyme
VLSCETTSAEVLEMYDFVAQTASATHIYLQPLTKVPLSPDPPSSEQMLKWLTMGIARQLNVRVLPQMHPLLNAR